MSTKSILVKILNISSYKNGGELQLILPTSYTKNGSKTLPSMTNTNTSQQQKLGKIEPLKSNLKSSYGDKMNCDNVII